MELKVAIIGLGRIGSILLQQIMNHKEKIKIAAIAELQETPGRILAKSAGIPIKNVEEICLLGEELDIIFELTGEKEVRSSLRNLLAAKENQHTVVATETIASLICLMLTDKTLPGLHEHTGY